MARETKDYVLRSSLWLSCCAASSNPLWVVPRPSECTKCLLRRITIVVTPVWVRRCWLRTSQGFVSLDTKGVQGGVLDGLIYVISSLFGAPCRAVNAHTSLALMSWLLLLLARNVCVDCKSNHAISVTSKPNISWYLTLNTRHARDRNDVNFHGLTSKH